MDSHTVRFLVVTAFLLLVLYRKIKPLLHGRDGEKRRLLPHRKGTGQTEESTGAEGNGYFYEILAVNTEECGNANTVRHELEMQMESALLRARGKGRNVTALPPVTAGAFLLILIRYEK